ncbi:MAG: putative monooxygenase [Thermodesulfobacteriota bacterium]|nr:putative monooxygenase [Thermodesulfobacteriota bacterium]
MIHTTSSQAKTYTAPQPHERELKVLISPSLQQGVEGLAVGMTILPAGNSSSSHSHEAECETWIVVSGAGEVLVGEERESVGPESVIFIPRNVKHQIINTGPETLRMFWIYTPPGGEKSVLEETIR